MQPLWETVQSFLKKLKIELPRDPAIPLLGNLSEEKKKLTQKDMCTPMHVSTAALFTIKIKGNLSVALWTDEWINKMRYIHTTK